MQVITQQIAFLSSKGELDPREIISLYPGMESSLCEAFQSQLVQWSKARDLCMLQQEDSTTFHHYLGFLGDFLKAVRGTEQGLQCSEEVDSALLWLYTHQGDNENLGQFAALPNACRLHYCIPVLEQHKRSEYIYSLFVVLNIKRFSNDRKSFLSMQRLLLVLS